MKEIKIKIAQNFGVERDPWETLGRFEAGPARIPKCSAGRVPRPHHSSWTKIPAAGPQHTTGGSRRKEIAIKNAQNIGLEKDPWETPGSP